MVLILLKLVEQIVLSFVASLCFGLILNVPRRTLIACGLAGASGWVTYWIANQILQDVILANFLGALSIGLVSLFGARKLKTPIIIINTPGLVPLVPGGAFYLAIRSAGEAKYLESIQYFSQTFIIVSALVVGFFFVKLFEQILAKLRKHKSKGK